MILKLYRVYHKTVCGIWFYEGWHYLEKGWITLITHWLRSHLAFQCCCFFIKKWHYDPAVCDRSWVCRYNALITQSLRMPSPQENTVFKRTGKTKLRARFSRCYNLGSQFSHQCPCVVQRSPAVINRWSTIFTFTDAILISFLGNLLSIVFSCAWQWISCSLVHVLRPIDNKHMVQF